MIIPSSVIWGIRVLSTLTENPTVVTSIVTQVVYVEPTSVITQFVHVEPTPVVTHIVHVQPTPVVTKVVYVPPTPAPTPQRSSADGVLPIVSNYAPGWCGIHVHEWKETCVSCHEGEITVNIYDAKQEQIGYIKSLVDYMDLERALYPEQRMPKPLTIKLGKDPTFRYGDDKWVAKAGEKGRCSVGKWNKSVGHSTRDMDCGFSC